MNITDLVNMFFELIAFIFVFINIIKLQKDKKVNGIHWISVLFFAVWGYYSLFFYNYNDLNYSFLGALLLSLTDTIWLIQILYYENINSK